MMDIQSHYKRKVLTKISIVCFLYSYVVCWVTKQTDDVCSISYWQYVVFFRGDKVMICFMAKCYVEWKALKGLQQIKCSLENVSLVLYKPKLTVETVTAVKLKTTDEWCCEV